MLAMKILFRISLMIGLLAAAVFVSTGCATTEPENRSERQQIPVPVKHDASIDTCNRFQDGLRKLRHALAAQKIVELIL
jgi:hypothetical protein